MGEHFVGQNMLLVVVDGLYRFEYAQNLPVFTGILSQCSEVFGETTATVAGTRIQETETNAGI